MSETKATKAEAQKVLTQVIRQRKAYVDAGYAKPRLTKERIFDWQAENPDWTIVWEEGPYEWAVQFPDGGKDWDLADCGDFRIEDVRDALPEGIWTEAHTTWALAVRKG
jgi:hypothetical protein